jgi:hypothetical protein
MNNSFTMLPPPADKCQCCAVAHPTDQPHDATSLYYAFWIKKTYGREATWNEALAHCPEAVKSHWVYNLHKIGIDLNSTKVRGEIKTDKQLCDGLGIKA